VRHASRIADVVMRDGRISIWSGQMSHDKTVELVMNLDRAAVEDKLQQVVAHARSVHLDDIVVLLGNFVGMSADDLRKRVALCLESVSASPEHQLLFAQLELIELNLPNLD
jgi:hypothetical protein